MKKRYTWEYIRPIDLEIGDVIQCYRHDDQWEQAEARIIDLCVLGPGEYVWENGYRKCYEYFVLTRCRHVGLKHLTASGGPEFEYGFFNWNHPARWNISKLDTGSYDFIPL